MISENIPVIQGQGGGGGKKGGGGNVTPNNLQSLARARFVELISEGEIEGLVNGARSIFFNQTPLQNEDGTYNFDNVFWEERKGLPDDLHVNGFQAVEQVTSVETEVKVSTGPVTRTIVQPNADAVRVIIRLNSLFTADNKGNINNYSVNYQIRMRPSGGTWITAVDKTIANRKSSSPVQLAHRIELPAGHTSWEIQVVRITADDPNEKTQSGLAWESYVTLVEGRFTYPHSAYVAMEVNAQDIGTSIPQRAFEVKGLKINVPTNYNPATRAYTGIWDGTFKVAWTNNPAWIFYDMIVNDRYGLGEFVNVNEIDKWGLYQIAQYSDGMVPSGFKDANGADIMEPRFTFNGVITTREEAYFALQKITTAFRGMGYWAIGQYFATADMPTDPALLVTPANVIEGKFTYSSTAMKARHNVALIKWNDPENFYRPATELVIDEASLQKNGWREKRLDFLGCTSRGLARRYGKWILDTENTETETVEYQAGFDHATLRPGVIIAIADPRRATMRMGGRIVSHVDNTVTLDADFIPQTGETYKIYLTMPDGSLKLLDVTGRPGTAQLTVAASATKAEAGSVYVLTASNLKPRNYRVLTVKEVSENVYAVSALFHDPNKFARVEQNIVLDDIPYRVEGVPTPPTNLVADQNTYLENGAVKTRLTLSWTPPLGTVVRSYLVQVEGTKETLAPMLTERNSIEIPGLNDDTYTLRVLTMDRQGRTSTAATLEVPLGGVATLVNFSVQSVQNLDSPGSSQFSGESPTITWINRFPVSADSTETLATSPLYKHNLVTVRDAATGTFLRSEIVRGNSYRYDIEFNRLDSIATGLGQPRRSLRFDVKVVDIGDNESNAATLTLTNPAPSAPIVSFTPGPENCLINWSANADNDLRGYRIWVETNSTFDPFLTIPKYDGMGNSFLFKGLKDTTYYVKIAAYDAFNKADMIVSGSTSFTTGSYEAIFDAAGLKNVEIVSALPAVELSFIGQVVFLTTDSKLYRFTANGWTAAVAAGDITGKIGEGQIAANAITAGLIAAGAITAEKLAANSITAENGAIADLSVGRLKLENGAVTDTLYVGGPPTASYVDSLTTNYDTDVPIKGWSLTWGDDPPEKIIIDSLCVLTNVSTIRPSSGTCNMGGGHYVKVSAADRVTGVKRVVTSLYRAFHSALYSSTGTNVISAADASKNLVMSIFRGDRVSGQYAPDEDLYIDFYIQKFRSNTSGQISFTFSHVQTRFYLYFK